MIWVVHPGSEPWFFTHPGSRILGTGSATLVQSWVHASLFLDPAMRYSKYLGLAAGPPASLPAVPDQHCGGRRGWWFWPGGLWACLLRLLSQREPAASLFLDPAITYLFRARCWPTCFTPRCTWPALWWAVGMVVLTWRPMSVHSTAGIPAGAGCEFIFRPCYYV